MAPKDLLAQRIKTERGLILLACRFSTGCLDRATIRGTLDGWGYPMEREHLMRQLAYCEERGWLRHEERTAADITLALYHITADGRDVLHGVVEHPGLTIPDTEG